MPDVREPSVNVMLFEAVTESRLLVVAVPAVKVTSPSSENRYAFPPTVGIEIPPCCVTVMPVVAPLYESASNVTVSLPWRIPEMLMVWAWTSTGSLKMADPMVTRCSAVVSVPMRIEWPGASSIAARSESERSRVPVPPAGEPMSIETLVVVGVIVNVPSRVTVLLPPVKSTSLEKRLIIPLESNVPLNRIRSSACRTTVSELTDPPKTASMALAVDGIRSDPEVTVTSPSSEMVRAESMVRFSLPTRMSPSTRISPVTSAESTSSVIEPLCAVRSSSN